MSKETERLEKEIKEIEKKIPKGYVNDKELNIMDLSKARLDQQKKAEKMFLEMINIFIGLIKNNQNKEYKEYNKLLLTELKELKKEI